MEARLETLNQEAPAAETVPVQEKMNWSRFALDMLGNDHTGCGFICWDQCDFCARACGWF
jgi:hypothetical protein